MTGRIIKRFPPDSHTNNIGTLIQIKKKGMKHIIITPKSEFNRINQTISSLEHGVYV